MNIDNVRNSIELVMALKYGKGLDLRPSGDIPALFDMQELEYVYQYNSKIKDVWDLLKYLYKSRPRSRKFERDKKFPLLRDLMKKKKGFNTHLINRLVEWQYTDNDGFWIKEESPKLKDAIFISLAVRDYVNAHR